MRGCFCDFEFEFEIRGKTAANFCFFCVNLLDAHFQNENEETSEE